MLLFYSEAQEEAGFVGDGEALLDCMSIIDGQHEPHNTDISTTPPLVRPECALDYAWSIRHSRSRVQTALRAMESHQASLLAMMSSVAAPVIENDSLENLYQEVWLRTKHAEVKQNGTQVAEDINRLRTTLQQHDCRTRVLLWELDSHAEPKSLGSLGIPQPKRMPANICQGGLSHHDFLASVRLLHRYVKLLIDNPKWNLLAHLPPVLQTAHFFPPSLLASLLQLGQSASLAWESSGTMDGGSGQHATAEHRKSRSAHLLMPGGIAPKIPGLASLLEEIMENAAKALKLPAASLHESLEIQLVHYQPQQYYKLHDDSSSFGRSEGAMHRVLTLFVYLNSVSGGTAFPFVQQESPLKVVDVESCFEERRTPEREWGIVAIEEATAKFNNSTCADSEASGSQLMVEPTAGSALLWQNYWPRSGRVDTRVRHRGCEVKGEKWGLNLWLTLTPQLAATLLHSDFVLSRG